MAIPHTALEIKAILARLGLKPERRLGQNFLVDQAVRDRVIQLAAIQPHDIVLEVGPGLGVLTEALAQRARRVVAVEKDGRLVDFLTGEFAGTARVTIVNNDIRRIDLTKLIGGEAQNTRTVRERRNLVFELVEKPKLRPASTVGSRLRSNNNEFPDGLGTSSSTHGWSVVASPPYYLVAFLVRQLLDLAHPPRQITLVVQKEVADRLAARAGEMNLLALAAKLVSRVVKHDRISRRAFWPQPKVDSAIVTLVAHAEHNRPLQRDEERLFFDFARPLFRGKRKQILGSISRSTGAPSSRVEIETVLRGVGVAPEARPEAISVDKWVALFRAFPWNRV